MFKFSSPIGSCFRRGGWRVTLLALPVLAALTMGGCPNGNGNDNSNDNGNDNGGGTISEDTTMATLTVADGDTLTIANDAVVTVTGDATLNGIVRAERGRLTLHVDGALTVNGRITALDEETQPATDDTPLSAQTVGIFIRVGDGAVAINDGSVLESTGPIVITDDDRTFDQTPADLFNEVEDVSGDDLPTLVPLPPDHSAFLDPADMKVALGPVLQGAGAPVTVSGTWPPAGAPPPPGDVPIIVFRFFGNRPLILDDYTINGPPAPAGASANEGMNDGTDANGGKGKPGMRLNITNNGGPINIVNTVTLNLTDGGPGGDATSSCATAQGGNGNDSGNFRMTAADGIDITAGMLIINPGRSGAGGNATVMTGPAGAAGCPGETGRNSTATGGRGGDNLKRVFVRGNVEGLENVTIGPVRAGDGGRGDATACDGGDGAPCCDGGPGGAGTATGGAGGNASFANSGFPISSSGALGGNGGAANALGGDGGDGGDCKFDDAGDGGAGGVATATGGTGGSGVASGGSGVGGDGGNATAGGGDGGMGGDSGLGAPGSGGAGGGAVATAGVGGTGDTAGNAGETSEFDGTDGLAGGDLPVTLYCINLAFLADAAGPIVPGRQNGPVTDSESMEQIGTIDVELLDTQNENYQRGDNPPHIGIGSGTMIVDVQSLTLADGTPPGPVGGVRIVPLDASGISPLHPLTVQALDANGAVLGEEPVSQLLEVVDVTFESIEVPAEFRFIFPEGVFVTIIQIYLIDP